jgi:hypothetical protein
MKFRSMRFGNVCWVAALMLGSLFWLSEDGVQQCQGWLLGCLFGIGLGDGGGVGKLVNRDFEKI